MGLFTKKKKIEDKEEPKKNEAANSNIIKNKAVVSQSGNKGRASKTELRIFESVNQVLLKPLVTEKISNLGIYNQYAFEVDKNANKIQIKKAIETYYHVKPIRINTINISGKGVRWGRTRGRTKDRKKAIVTLRQGDKIEVYEGV